MLHLKWSKASLGHGRGRQLRAVQTTEAGSGGCLQWGGLRPSACVKILYLKGRSREENWGPLGWWWESLERWNLNSTSNLGKSLASPLTSQCPQTDGGVLSGPPQRGPSRKSGRAQLQPWVPGDSGIEVKVTVLRRLPQAWAFCPHAWVTRAGHWPCEFTGSISVSLWLTRASCCIWSHKGNLALDFGRRGTEGTLPKSWEK